MNKNRVVLAAAMLILIFLVILSLRNKPPFIPADDLHRGLTSNDACMVCHGPGKRAPLKEAHPPKEQCLICHKVKPS